MTDHDHSALGEFLAEAGDGMRFDAGFAERVMARLSTEGGATDDIAEALARQTRRVIPLLAAASLALIALNWRSTRATADSALAAALGIRATTSTASTGSMTGLEGAEAFQ